MPCPSVVESFAEGLDVNESELDDVVRTLIDTCEVTACGIRRCAGNADHMALQLIMTQRAGTWHRWAGELQTLCSIPAVPRATQRSEVAAVMMLSVDSDLALLSECERGEQRALQQYRNALEFDVPRVARAVLQRHVDGIQASRAQMRSLHAGAMLAPA